MIRAHEDLDEKKHVTETGEEPVSAKAQIEPPAETAPEIAENEEEKAPIEPEEPAEIASNEIEARDDEKPPKEQPRQTEPPQDESTGEEEIVPSTLDESYSPEEPHDYDEYVVISQDEVPMEFAEEYPAIQV